MTDSGQGCSSIQPQATRTARPGVLLTQLKLMSPFEVISVQYPETLFLCIMVLREATLTMQSMFHENHF